MTETSRRFIAIAVLLMAVFNITLGGAQASVTDKLKRTARSATNALYNQIRGPSTGNTVTPTSSAQPMAPLQGSVEQLDRGGLVDVSQFSGQASSGQNGFRLPRSAGVNQTDLRSGVDQNTLRGGTGVPGTARPGFALGGKRVKLQGDISDKELTTLGSYDVVVMQDRSSSMGEDERILGRHGEGLRKMSRWDWCVQEAADFTRQTSALSNWYFTLVLFSSRYDVFHHVALNQIPYIYSRSGIFIGTRLADPMGEQIAMYFQRRQHGERRPLLIAVITDGKPQDDENLRDLLIQTTYRMQDPREVKIVFLQVGTDGDGSEKLYKLDNKLQRNGAKFDIVSVKPFYEILNIGLTRALVDTIQRGG